VAAGHGEDEGITCNSDSLNTGHRIDYCFVSADLAPRIKGARIDSEATGSDHQPVWTDIDL
jgi:exonuclease III